MKAAKFDIELSSWSVEQAQRAGAQLRRRARQPTRKEKRLGMLTHYQIDAGDFGIEVSDESQQSVLSLTPGPHWLLLVANFLKQ
ncbi:hypothetical protein AK812_SmicGene13180 [Symbiodinium microadriaticum]|uniref:Uncharacterized protein n=1 Tax=Symbiodinium microadriaticum TaxID=2951 RepID=A0A1Q9E8Q3_SYMMI|nr:hypothetical protein AK812_SmicGene13180 [Symbiodinium microadriaticum]